MSRIRVEARVLTPHERLRALIGAAPGEYVRLGYPPDAWRRWDERFGPAFRLRHNIAKDGDAERFKRGTVDMFDRMPMPPPLDR